MNAWMGETGSCIIMGTGYACVRIRVGGWVNKTGWVSEGVTEAAREGGWRERGEVKLDMVKHMC